MQISHDVIDGDITRIYLAGRMDIDGTEAIDSRFTTLTSRVKAAIVVDMSEVYFIASIGMRSLITAARAQAHCGGSLVLYRPQPLVGEALITAGIAALIPVCDDMPCALEKLQPARCA